MAGPYRIFLVREQGGLRAHLTLIFRPLFTSLLPYAICVPLEHGIVGNLLRLRVLHPEMSNLCRERENRMDNK